MKRTIIALLLLIGSHGAFAQSGALTINNNTDFPMKVVVYAHTGSTLCGGMVGYPISIPRYSPVTFSDPCNFETTVGWSTSGSVCPSAPTSFQWDHVDFVSPLLLSLCGLTWWFQGVIGDGTVGCAFPSSLGPGAHCVAPWTFSASWSPATGSAMTDVTVNLDEY